MMRADPAALRAASAGAQHLAAELPVLADDVVSSAQAVSAGCPGFATGAALVAVADAWRARLAAVGGAFANTAAVLTATADSDESADRAAAEVFDGAVR
ncbi:hypothetical protein [Streptodolium elevatio]|uniref:Excreted virulence factor EspC (Type VII ESX diderm) n=1 Tax=Streptodolium elevatio TaxID=3157996 RepID=A0ABV3D8I8_9ACTN